MSDYIRRRWAAPGGYAEFLRLAVPLFLSTASWSIQHFVDRVFLTWYSTEALAAALPGGLSNFVFTSFFIGMAQYINTFVAQYTGAGQDGRVGPAVWQGAYLALAGVLFGLGLALLAEPLFVLIGHEEKVRLAETEYFRVLCYGVGPITLSTAASCFFSGRGQTWTVLAVNVGATLVNIVLDYGLIFGAWGLPSLGMRGAAWATNVASLCGALSFLALMVRPVYRRRFNTLAGWRLDAGLFRRLLRYGGPSGLNFMLDIFAFSFFVLIVGRLGTIPLAATNLAFNINSLAFMPLIGAGIAISTMVGQRLGDDRPEDAEYCTWSGLHLSLFYMGVMAAAYIFLPDFFLAPFDARSQDPNFGEVRAVAVVLLRIVALYCVFDAFYMGFTAALKGAGDTRYVMWVSVVLSWVVMLVPCMVALEYFGAGLYVLWLFICAYIVLMGVVFFFRFRVGRWKGMRVIENVAQGAKNE